MIEQEKRENVIKGLEAIVKDDWMWKKADYYTGICKDALALLKAQEPVAPIRRSAHAQGADEVWYECGKCGEFLGVNRHSKQFCAKCGMEMKWE